MSRPQLPPLMEIMPFRVLEMTEIEEGGEKRLKVKGVYGRADERNLNGRIYPLNLTEREVAKINRRIAEGNTVFQQADHPADGQSKIRDTSAILRGVNVDPMTKEVVGESVILNTSTGKDLAEIIRAGGKIGVSSRGFGTTQVGEVGGVKGNVVQDDYSLVTYDFVIGQSTPGAVVTSFAEQALIGLAEGEQGMEWKDVTIESLRKERPDLVTALEQALNAGLQARIDAAVATKVAEAETRLKSEQATAVAAKALEVETRLKGEHATKLEQETSKLKTEHARALEAAKPKPATDAQVETIVKNWAASHNLELVAKGSGNGNGSGNGKLEQEVADLKKTLQETRDLVQAGTKRMDEVSGKIVKSEVTEYILEKTKGEKQFQTALTRRLMEKCTTREQVDQMFESEKAFLQVALNEVTGAGRTTNVEPLGTPTEPGSEEQKSKVKLASGAEMVLTEQQIAQRRAAGIPTTVVQ